MSEETTTRREAAGTAERAEAGAAAEACVDLFNGLLQFGASTQKDAIDQLVTRIQSHESNVRAQVDFDTNGVLSFTFFELRNGMEPRQLVDALPARKLNS